MEKLKYSSLVFVSGNKDKHREYCDLLGLSDLTYVQVPVPEPQSLNLSWLVEKKIESVRPQRPETPFFVEHTGLIIDAWMGLPGGLTQIFMDTVGNEGICKMMTAYAGQDRIARARVVIGFFHHTTKIQWFQGEVTGTIAPRPKGQLNFGWDPIFVPDEGDGRTYGEMTLAEKNATSMRKRAVATFAPFLDNHFEL